MMGTAVVGAPDLSQDELSPFIAHSPMTDPEFLPRYGVELMELMRRKVGSTVNMFCPDAAAGYVVGGLCTLTTITRDGAKSVTLKRWDDVKRERINPYREAGNVTPIGNRKQRRAMKREGWRRIA